MGSSRAEARQLIRHGHFTVNGNKVDIPSYLLKPGDVIAINESSKSLQKFKELAEVAESKNHPEWLEFDNVNLVGKVVRLPNRDEIDLQIQEHLIVELYSK